MSTKVKNFPFYIEKMQRKRFANKEIFFNTCSILKQCRFSANLSYYLFKRRLSYTYLTTVKNFCIFTGKSHAVSSKLRISRIKFARKLDSGQLSGFYRSV